jgi:hypothetical protein
VADSELTDREIEAALSARPATWWEELFAAFDELEPADPDVAWEGGGPSNRADADGNETQVLSFPWPAYSPRVDAVIRLLGDLVCDYPFDWMAWADRHGRRDTGAVAPGSVADAARTLTTLVRGERFCDGTIANALADGTLAAVIERLRQWRATEA